VKTSTAFPSIWIASSLLMAGSFPRLVQAQWVENPGEGWVDVTVYHLDTTENFGFNGDVGEFFADGHAVSTSVFLTLAGGLAPGVDTWLQIPYHRLRYDDARDDRLRTGVGDTNVYLRVAPLRFVGFDFPLSIRGGVKVAVGDFAVDSEIIPLGDGQTDWEVMGEVGHSFFPRSAYLSGWLGYRWRELNEEAQRDFADEAFFLAQLGGSYGSVGVQFLVEGMRSVTTPVFEGIPLANGKRSILQLTPRASYPLGPGSLSLGARIPIRGKNLPAGTAVVVGYFSRWSL
jgi:hypothetical protein